MSDATPEARPGTLPSTSWVGAMGLELWTADGLTHGRADVLPGMLAPGTDRLRVGVLATLVDVVGGTPPTGAMNPTVDLRVQLLSPPPTSGTVRLVCRPLKLGKRLYWADVPIHVEGRAEPFALGTVTFMSRVIASMPRFSGRTGPPPAGTFDDLVGATRLDGGVTEVVNNEAIANGMAGTIQGGAQVAFAEVAIEWALAERGEHRLTDVDIRYLNRLVGDRLRAEPELADGFGGVVARIPLTDPGGDDRVVSFVQAVARRV